MLKTIITDYGIPHWTDRLTPSVSTQIFRASQNSEVFLRYLYDHSDTFTVTPTTLPSSVSTLVFRASQNSKVLHRYLYDHFNIPDHHLFRLKFSEHLKTLKSYFDISTIFSTSLITTIDPFTANGFSLTIK
jgi:hypothetical protein